MIGSFFAKIFFKKEFKKFAGLKKWATFASHFQREMSK